MSGPFGLQQGMKLDEIPFESEEVAPCLYVFTNLPKNHSSFSQYILRITPNFALTWIKAIGKSMQTDAFGFQLSAQFEDFMGRLKKIYGESELTDFLIDGSCWDQPEDWMRGLECGERILGSRWAKDNGVDLPNDLTSIYLGAFASSSEEGKIVVEYSFENEDAAEAEIKSLEDDAL